MGGYKTSTCAFKGLSPFASARLQHRNVCTTLAVEGLDTLRLGNMISSGVLQGCGVDHAFKGLIPFASACNRIYVPTLPSRGYSLRLGSAPLYFSGASHIQIPNFAVLSTGASNFALKLYARRRVHACHVIWVRDAPCHTNILCLQGTCTLRLGTASAFEGLHPPPQQTQQVSRCPPSLHSAL